MAYDPSRLPVLSLLCPHYIPVINLGISPTRHYIPVINLSIGRQQIPKYGGGAEDPVTPREAGISLNRRLLLHQVVLLL